jgi:hypothetical protein
MISALSAKNTIISAIYELIIEIRAFCEVYIVVISPLAPLNLFITNIIIVLMHSSRG